MPGVAPEHRDAVGDGFLRLYTQLWDEDEAMMRERARSLGATPTLPREALDLGPEDALRASLPRCVTFGGRPFRLCVVEGALVVYATQCPHWLGPLPAPGADGQTTCPWHGYRFDVRNGARTDAPSPMRLPPPPRIERRDGRVRLAR